MAWHRFTNCGMLLYAKREEITKVRLKQYFSILELIQLLQSEHSKVLEISEKSSPHTTNAVLGAITNHLNEARKDADKAWRRYCYTVISKKLLPAPVPKRITLFGTEVLCDALQEANAENPGLIKYYNDRRLLDFKY